MTLRFAMWGAVLALGAPGGWLLVRMLRAGVEPLEELLGAPDLYAYLLFGTMISFSAFGVALGRVNSRLRELTLTDGLTGLRNARAFQEQLRIECARADRAGIPVALIAIDLDHFKRVNDERGHAFGDRALIHAARLLSASARTSDLPCRIGGEEFAVICPGARLEDAVWVAERIRASLEAEPVRSDLGPWPLTASCGVAVREPGVDPEAAFRLADTALYLAKSNGRNRVEAARAG